MIDLFTELAIARFRMYMSESNTGLKPSTGAANVSEQQELEEFAADLNAVYMHAAVTCSKILESYDRYSCRIESETPNVFHMTESTLQTVQDKLPPTVAKSLERLLFWASLFTNTYQPELHKFVPEPSMSRANFIARYCDDRSNLNCFLRVFVRNFYPHLIYNTGDKLQNRKIQKLLDVFYKNWQNSSFGSKTPNFTEQHLTEFIEAVKSTKIYGLTKPKYASFDWGGTFLTAVAEELSKFGQVCVESGASRYITVQVQYEKEAATVSTPVSWTKAAIFTRCTAPIVVFSVNLMFDRKFPHITYDDTGKPINNESNSHANLLIVNKNTKEIEHFEPHGRFNRNETLENAISGALEKHMQEVMDLVGQSYKFFNPDSFCPVGRGPQIVMNDTIGYCAPLSILYGEMRLRFHWRTREQIIKDMNVCVKSSDFMENYIYYALNYTKIEGRILTKPRSLRQSRRNRQQIQNELFRNALIGWFSKFRVSVEDITHNVVDQEEVGYEALVTPDAPKFSVSVTSGKRSVDFILSFEYFPADNLMYLDSIPTEEVRRDYACPRLIGFAKQMGVTRLIVTNSLFWVESPTDRKMVPPNDAASLLMYGQTVRDRAFRFALNPAVLQVISQPAVNVLSARAIRSLEGDGIAVHAGTTVQTLYLQMHAKVCGLIPDQLDMMRACAFEPCIERAMRQLESLVSQFTNSATTPKMEVLELSE